MSMTTSPVGASASTTHEVWRALAPVRRTLGIVTPTGWGLLAAAVVLAGAGLALGWVELVLAAVALVVLLALALALVLGGSKLRLDVRLNPPRVTAGRSSAGQLLARNLSTRRMRSATVEMPVGATMASFTIPRLRPGGHHLIDFTVPTVRRGVIPVGPVTTVRADPFGLTRPVVSTSERVELCVHPVLMGLPSLDAGMIRDLEGRSTSDPSTSDLDFHTLRSYMPGDERRHIHWRSSARETAARGTTTLLTKSYTDTRRSHLGVIVDGRIEHYQESSGGEKGDADTAFEAGITAAASVAVRALRDEMDVTVVASTHTMDRVGIPRTLDGFARVTPSEHDLPTLAARAVSLAPGMSILLLVTGHLTDFPELRRAAAQLPPSVRVVVLRVRLGEKTRTGTIQGVTMLSMGAASDLPRLVTVAGLG